MKKIIFLPILIVILLTSMGCQQDSSNEKSNEESTWVGDGSQEYYMITFLSGIDYWKGIYSAFEEAGNQIGVNTVYTGSAEYDINQATTVLDQVISQQPAGIAIATMNADAYRGPIDRAIEMGIPVVTFDADSPDSNRYTYLSTGNINAGEYAAHTMAEAIGNEGKIGIVSSPGPENINEREDGFIKIIEKEYPNIEIVQQVHGQADQNIAAQQTSSLLQNYPDIDGLYATYSDMSIGATTALRDAGLLGDVKLITFDTDQVTLEGIKNGEIYATVAQGRYNMGYWSMMMLYGIANDLISPIENWEENNINPLPNFVDTGVSIIDINNVDAYYEAEFGQ